MNIKRLSRRRIGLTSLLLGLALAAALAGLAAAPSPAVLEDQVGAAAVRFSADRTRVFSGGGCVRLEWQAEGINTLWLGANPVTGAESRDWCLPPRAAFGVAALRVQFPDESWREYPLRITAVDAALWYTALPLLALGLAALAPGGWWAQIGRARRLRPLAGPFMQDGRVIWPLLLLFVAVNGAALVNAARHHPGINYDASAHEAYMRTLAQLRLPTPEDSYEFFSPPLPYVVPALALRLAGCAEAAPDRCVMAALKIGQLQNVALALALTWVLLRLCARLRPDPAFRLLALALLGLLPVYYKTFSMMRGEPFVLFFTVYTLDRLLVMLPPERRPMRGDALRLGLALGLMLLSRQWGALVVAAVGLWALVEVTRRGRAGLPLLRAGLAAFGLAFAISAWFYLAHQVQYGSMLAFNRDPKAEITHPADFYTGLGNGLLFSAPYGTAFSRQIIPKFYSELWGDYEGYFVLSHREPMTAEMLAYMGRVNAAGLLATGALLAGLLWGIGQARGWRRGQPEAAFWALLALITLVSYAGYLWFLTHYPNVSGDTIKATYMLHTFAPLALLGAGALLGLRQRAGAVFRLALAGLALAALHNLPALFTQHTAW